MDRQELLREIASLIESQESAISQHPPATVRVYQKGRDAFVEGQGSSVQQDWMGTAGLILADIALVQRYMLSSSFISSWYHLKGQQEQRDKAAHSCATLVSGLGLDGDGVLLRHIEYERLWRRAMKAEGVPHPAFPPW